MNKTLVTILVSSLLLSGCTTTKNNKEAEATSNIDYEMLALEEQKKLYDNLEEIANKALEAQRIRQKVQNAASVQVMDADQVREALWQESYVPEGMDAEVPIDWKGAPEPLLKVLANYSHYEIYFENNPYPIARDIVIPSSRMNVKKLIDEVERQSQGYISDIKIYEKLKIIKVIYEQH